MHPGTARRVPPGSRTEAFQALPSTGYARWGKRLFDIIVGSALLLVSLPVMAAIGVALRISLGSGVLFRQIRTGRHGNLFTMLKFRTMLPDRRMANRPFEGPDRRVRNKDPRDPRHTPLGRMLRRSSLDELPQLLNVLKGDMSLVGPRPEVEVLAAGFLDHPRHAVRPGMTGAWQVSPMRADAVIRDGLDLDERYVATMSLRGDVRILLRTAGAMLRFTGS